MNKAQKVEEDISDVSFSGETFRGIMGGAIVSGNGSFHQNPTFNGGKIYINQVRQGPDRIRGCYDGTIEVTGVNGTITYTEITR